MKKTLMSVGLLALCFVMAAAIVGATPIPVCSTTPPTNNLILYAGSGTTTTPITAAPSDANAPCSINTLTFQNFSYVINSGSSTTTPPDVALSAISTGNPIVLTLNPNLASGSDMDLAFQVVGGINEVNLQFAETTTSNGFVNETVCTVFDSLSAPCPTGDIIATLFISNGTVTAAAGAACPGTCTTSTLNGDATVQFSGFVSQLWVLKD